MDIYENFSLKNYHTFGIEVSCRYFVDVTSVEQLQDLLASPLWKDIPKLILGEGSNVLFSQDFPGLVIKVSLKGIKKTDENAEHIWIEAKAGENWHQLVMHCIQNQWAGIENLSLIPGTVGAAPLQNIGAYGVELRDIFEKLIAIRIQDGKICEFDHAACHFGYRDSIFKNAGKNQYIILSVLLRLNKTPFFHTEYGAIKETLAAMKINELSIQHISQAVIQIRQQKLPDPKKIGNAGSFFKSPVVPLKTFIMIRDKYPKIPYFLASEGQYKIPAGWLIEQCGWKGHRIGDTGVHQNHALVLVNYGKSSGHEIKQLAEKIQASVKEKFSVNLVPEVNII